MEQSLNKRFADFVDLKKISPPELYKNLGVTRQTYNGWVNAGLPIPLKQVQKFVDMYPDLDARWLLVGSGTMLNENHYLKNGKTLVTEDEISAYSNEKIMVPMLQETIVTLKQLVIDKQKIIDLLERK